MTTAQWTGIAPGKTAPCQTCGREMGGRRTARRDGVLAHGGNGQCQACVSRQRRAEGYVPPAKPEPEPVRANLRERPVPPILAGGWRVRAACITADPTMFDEVVSREGEVPEPARKAAQEFCAKCPVIDSCDREAETDKRVGLWAGIYRTVRKYVYERHPLVLGPDAS